jgi:hypothetical protein
MTMDLWHILVFLSSAGAFFIGLTWPYPGVANYTAMNFGGGTSYSYIAAASANQDSQVIKAAAGTLYSLSISNIGSAIRWVKFYNTAAGPTSSSTPVLRIMIPYGLGNGAGNNWTIGVPGIAFTAGIAFRITVNEADNDATAVTAGDVVINLSYN